MSVLSDVHSLLTVFTTHNTVFTTHHTVFTTHHTVGVLLSLYSLHTTLWVCCYHCIHYTPHCGCAVITVFTTHHTAGVLSSLYSLHTTLRVCCYHCIHYTPHCGCAVIWYIYNTTNNVIPFCDCLPVLKANQSPLDVASATGKENIARMLVKHLDKGITTELHTFYQSPVILSCRQDVPGVGRLFKPKVSSWVQL